jgi:arylsulfatase A-like enzyme
MKLVFRRPAALAVSVLLVTALAAAAAPSPAPSPAAPRAPKLAVVVAVDGLSYDRLLFYRPWYIAGLKRLLDQGLVMRKTYFKHFNTETGPGHASLGTGAPPRVTGIVMNNWFETRPGGRMEVVYCTDQPDPVDPSSPPISGTANLRVPTLGDRLVETRSSARVVSMSGKDRGAIFLAGKNPNHAVYWYDRETGRFVTSAAYQTKSGDGAAAAGIVKMFNLAKGGGTLPGRFGLVWKKWAAPAPASSSPLPTPVPPAVIQRFQYPSNGLGFDHDLSKYGLVNAGGPPGYFGGVYRSPLVDELTADLVLAFLSDSGFELGHRSTPDMLCISFSGHDSVSHDYGNESEEEFDVLRRLDVQLGRIFDALDTDFPKGTVLVGFSADHGFPMQMPDVAKRLDKQFAGARVDVGDTALDHIVVKLNGALAGTLCLDPRARPIFGLEGWDLFYNRSAFPMKTVAGECGEVGRSVTTEDVDRVLPKVVSMLYREEFEKVLLVSQRATWPTDSVVAFIDNDFYAGRSGDAFLIPRPGTMVSYNPGRGAAHGTQYDYDTHVPLVFWGAVTGGGSDEPATPYDLAPTIGKWLGVSLPDAVGKPLPLSK